MVGFPSFYGQKNLRGGFPTAHPSSLSPSQTHAPETLLSLSQTLELSYLSFFFFPSIPYIIQCLSIFFLYVFYWKKRDEQKQNQTKL
jgi:hypothetical protein